MTTIPFYKFCSPENKKCIVNENSSVAYLPTDNKTNNTVYFRNTNLGIDCNNMTFGDPAVGYTKQCLSIPVPNNIAYDTNGNPMGFQFCSPENSVCKPNTAGAADVLYGSNRNFIYANIVGSVPCNQKTFGKINNNTNNVCFWRKSNIQETPAPIAIDYVNNNGLSSGLSKTVVPITIDYTNNELSTSTIPTIEAISPIDDTITPIDDNIQKTPIENILSPNENIICKPCTNTKYIVSIVIIVIFFIIIIVVIILIFVHKRKLLR